MEDGVFLCRLICQLNRQYKCQDDTGIIDRDKFRKMFHCLWMNIFTLALSVFSNVQVARLLTIKLISLIPFLYCKKSLFMLFYSQVRNNFLEYCKYCAVLKCSEEGLVLHRSFEIIKKILFIDKRISILNDKGDRSKLIPQTCNASIKLIAFLNNFILILVC